MVVEVNRLENTIHLIWSEKLQLLTQKKTCNVNSLTNLVVRSERLPHHPHPITSSMAAGLVDVPELWLLEVSEVHKLALFLLRTHVRIFQRYARCRNVDTLRLVSAFVLPDIDEA